MAEIQMIRMIPNAIRTTAPKEDQTGQKTSFLEMLKEKQQSAESQIGGQPEQEPNVGKQEEAKGEEDPGQKLADAVELGAVEMPVAAGIQIPVSLPGLVDLTAVEDGLPLEQTVAANTPEIAAAVDEEMPQTVAGHTKALQENAREGQPEAPILKSAVSEQAKTQAAGDGGSVQVEKAEASLPYQEDAKESSVKTETISQKTEAETAFLKKDKKTADAGVRTPEVETAEKQTVSDLKPAGRETVLSQKPASVHEPVRTTQAELPANVAKAIAARMPANQGTLTIELEPASLGKVTVSVIYENGHTSLSLMASNPKTLELLSRNAGEIAGILENKTGQETIIYTSEPQQESTDSREGGGEGRREPEKDRQEKKKQPDSFLQQLRLGLV